MLARFKTSTVVVRRLKATTGNKRIYFATATAAGNIQTDDRTQQNVEGVYADFYLGFFDIDTDIKEGDQLIEQRTGEKFKVLRIRQEGFGMGLQSAHLEVKMERSKA